jgi:dihydroflavonol-4-reductase
MKILVTGADGLLGNNLVRELLSRNHKVRVLLLPNSDASSLDGLNIERFFGNILNPQDIEKSIQDCDAVIHAAANTNIWPSRSEIIRKVNIDGTQNIIDAALKAKIKRLVYIGTANSFGFGSKENPGNEQLPYQSAKYGLDYMDSKLEAQQLILKAVKEKGLAAITVNPTFMLGPYDTKPSAGALILAIYEQKVPGFAPGGRNYVSVKDAAIAIANGLTKGKIGESYIVGNVNLSYEEMFTLVAKIVNVKPPKIKIPSFFIKIYGLIGSAYGNLFKKAPTVSYPMAQISCDEHYFTAQKARNELDLPQTNIEIAIKESFDWLKENGYCN